jgi:hypothetical protein
MGPARPSRGARWAVALLAAAVVIGAAGHLTADQARALTLAASPDSYSVSHDHSLDVPKPGVLNNDVGLLGSNVSLVSGVSHGSLTLRSDGSFSYGPAAGYVGDDSFRYRAGLLATASVTIHVTNALPVARNDAYTWGGGTLNVSAPGVLGNDTDADGDTLTPELVGGGVSGSLDLNANGSFQLRPGGGFGSSGSFQYRVTDGRGWSATVTVTLTILSSTPTPRPSPSPTPQATPRATQTPRPSLPLPSLPGPSLPVPSTGLPSMSGLQPTPPPTPESSAEVDEATPRPSTTALPSSGPSPSAKGISPASGALPPGAGGFRVTIPRAPAPEFTVGLPTADGGGLALDLGILGFIGGLETWAVPAATVGGVGLLVLLFAGLQAGGTIIWLPAVRRLRGERAPRRRRRR